MRWSSLLLVLFAAAFLFACGGDDEYVSEPGSGDAAEGGGDAAKKASEKAPPKKDIPRMSPMANTIGRDYKMVDAVRDYDAKKKKALQRGEYYETQSVTGDANFYLGLLWRVAEEHTKAADTFVKFVNQCPTDRNYRTGLYYAGIELAKDGRLADASGYVEKFGNKFPSEKKYWRSMASTVGYAMLADGDFSGAIDMLGIAAKHGDNYAGEEMVRCMWAQGEYDQARARANSLKADFNGGPEQKRYDSVADLASRMGTPAAALDVEGWSRRVDIVDLEGKPYLIYFWSLKNIGTAKGTEKRLKALYDRYAGEGIEFIGLSKHTGFDLVKGAPDPSMGTEEELTQIKTWADPLNAATPWWLGLCGDDSLHNLYGYRGKVPAIALVGKKGNLRYFRDSKDDAGYAIIAKVIEKLLEE